MTRFLKIFGAGNGVGQRSETESKYATAMKISDELRERMRSYSEGADPAKGVLADIWSQRHNVPFMTTVVEAVAEAGAAIKQRPEDLPQ